LRKATFGVAFCFEVPFPELAEFALPDEVLVTERSGLDEAIAGPPSRMQMKARDRSPAP
jgi:hypothetical protein